MTQRGFISVPKPVISLSRVSLSILTSYVEHIKTDEKDVAAEKAKIDRVSSSVSWPDYKSTTCWSTAGK